MKDHISTMTVEEAIEYLGSHATFGLSVREAQLRKKEYPRNTLPPVTLRTLLPLAFHPAHLGLVILFMVSSMFVKSFFISATIMLWIFMFSSLLLLLRNKNINYLFERRKYQEELLPEYVSCLRGGKVKTLPCEELTPGDIVYVSKGEFIPADLRVLSSSGLVVDESAVLGPRGRSSVKSSEELSHIKHTSHFSNILYAGSFVTEGSAKTVVWHTGKDRLLETLSDPLLLIKNPPLSFIEFAYSILSICAAIGVLMVAILHGTTTTTLSFFILMLGLGTPLMLPVLRILQDTPLPIKHVLLPLDSFVSTQVEQSTLFVQGTTMSLQPGADVVKHRDFFKQFFQLFFAAYPKEIEEHLFHDLRELRKYLTKVLKLEEIHHRGTNSSFLLLPEQESFEGKAVYSEADTDGTILVFGHPRDLVKRATYLFDEHMHTSKRRFFKGERERILEHIQAQEDAGMRLYGLATEETIHKQNKKVEKLLTITGYVAIPQQLQKQLPSSTAHHIWLYSFKKYPTHFLEKSNFCPHHAINTGNDIEQKSLHYLEHFSHLPKRIIHDCSRTHVLQLIKLLTTEQTYPLLYTLDEELLYHTGDYGKNLSGAPLLLPKEQTQIWEKNIIHSIGYGYPLLLMCLSPFLIPWLIRQPTVLFLLPFGTLFLLPFLILKKYQGYKINEE